VDCPVHRAGQSPIDLNRLRGAVVQRDARDRGDGEEQQLQQSAAMTA